MKTLVAFVDTNGGVIFLEMDTDAPLVAFEEDVRDKITDLIADYCDSRLNLKLIQKRDGDSFANESYWMAPK